jgi:chorismate synthase
VAAAAVIGENVTAITLAQAFVEKFGGDSIGEIRRNLEGYLAYVRSY